MFLFQGDAEGWIENSLLLTLEIWELKALKTLLKLKWLMLIPVTCKWFFFWLCKPLRLQIILTFLHSASWHVFVCGPISHLAFVYFSVVNDGLLVSIFLFCFAFLFFIYFFFVTLMHLKSLHSGRCYNCNHWLRFVCIG